ncbi:minor tail protein [Arthrobacter phage Lewando]|nr:minor tail protein [Arthrobacter phage Lewando]
MALTPTDPTKAQIWIRGTAPDQIIDLYVPRGAKGEPGGINYGTVLGTADLNSIMTSGVYRQMTTSDAQLLRNYPQEAESGVMLVLERVTSNTLIQLYYPIYRPSVFFERNYNNGTWSTWRAFPAQRVDQTAGRAIYTYDPVNQRDQLIYGDTGWREFAAPVVANGVSSGNFRIRRMGQQVQLFTVDVALSTAVTGYCVLLSPTQIPLGFRPHGGWRSMQAIGSQNNAVAQQWITNFGEIGWTHQVSTAGVFSTSRPTVNLYGSITWTTDEPWPTTLPGIAQGAIPNL